MISTGIDAVGTLKISTGGSCVIGMIFIGECVWEITPTTEGLGLKGNSCEIGVSGIARVSPSPCAPGVADLERLSLTKPAVSSGSHVVCSSGVAHWNTRRSSYKLFLALRKRRHIVVCHLHQAIHDCLEVGLLSFMSCIHNRQVEHDVGSYKYPDIFPMQVAQAGQGWSKPGDVFFGL